MAKLSMSQDPSKKKAVAPKLKMEQKPSIDSVRATKKLLESPTYKGKNIDPTVAGTNKRLKRLVAEHVAPMVMEHKGKADSTYNYNKAKNPAYEGVSSRELDKVTGGKGKQMIEANETYQEYRKVASPLKHPSLKGTPMVEKEKYVPKMDGGKGGKEKLYVPDERMAKSPAKKSTALKMPVKKK